MCELSPQDLERLRLILRADLDVGGLRLDERYAGVPPRRDHRLIDSGFVELVGDRLHVTAVGKKLLETQGVS